MPRTRRKTAAELAEDLMRRQDAKRQAAKLPENWGADDATLAQQPDVESRAASRGGASYHHRRDDMHRLHARGAISNEGLTAYRRLETDQAQRMGEAGSVWSGMPRLDGKEPKRCPLDHQIEAGRRFDEVLALVTPADRALLTEMVAPARVLAPPFGRWRLVVAVIVGERDDDKRSAHLKAACDALAYAYRLIDSGERCRVAA